VPVSLEPFIEKHWASYWAYKKNDSNWWSWPRLLMNCYIFVWLAIIVSPPKFCI
jgi:hypothetical protein